MRPGPFEYTRATRLSDALRAMAGGAVPLAGGQSLLQAMRLRQAEPAALVDLASVSDLSAAIETGDDMITVGARVTHRAFAENAAIARDLPWLTEAALALGDVQVRNLGTTLGNVCWADPRANMAVALLATDAVIVAAGPDDADVIERIPIDRFFAGFRQNVLDGRLATAIEVPRHAGARGRYIEFSRQRQDLALCNVCVVVRADRTARIAIGGVDQRPVRLPEVEAAMADSDPAAIASALDRSLASPDLRPVEDPYGSRDYKLDLARVLVRRAIEGTGATSR